MRCQAGTRGIVGGPDATDRRPLVGITGTTGPGDPTGITAATGTTGETDTTGPGDMAGEHRRRDRTTSTGRRPVARLVTAGLLVAVLATVACGADDRALKPPSPDQTTTTRPPSSVPAGSETVVAEELRLSSTAFAQNGALPDRYTCRGAGTPPPLAWENVPAGTEELAIVMRGTDPERTLHWVMSGINPRAGELLEGEVPPTVMPFPNEVNGQPGWGPPCPSTPGTHRYDFSVYALSEALRIPPLSTGQQAVQAIEAAPRLGIALITATVSV